MSHTITIEEAVPLAAKRFSALLCRWWGLSPLSKADNGERSSAPAAMATLMQARLIASAAPLPSDAEERAYQAILARLGKDDWKRSDGRIYRTLDLAVDYHPNPKAAELGEEVGVSPAQWPNKSSLSIRITGPAENVDCLITESRGYQAPWVSSTMLPGGMGGGWLVGPAVDPLYLGVVVEAVRAGRIEGARIEAA